MLRRGYRPLVGRVLAAGVGGTALAHSQWTSASCEKKSKKSDLEKQHDQWLWTHEGVIVRRTAAGDLTYIDQATGNTLPSRPESLPKEAYANRWRSPPFSDFDDQSTDRRRAVRHVFLIRHSQYNVHGATDAERTLTDMGHQQAIHLAKRLASIHSCTEGVYSTFSLDKLLSSELTRAIQTSDAIAPALPDATRSRDATLNEGRPCLPEPQPRHASHYTNRGNDAERIERAYRLICAKPPPPPPPPLDAPDKSEPVLQCDVIVCHANVIRYVVCRALVRGRPGTRAQMHAQTRIHAAVLIKVVTKCVRVCVCVCRRAAIAAGGVAAHQPTARVTHAPRRPAQWRRDDAAARRCRPPPNRARLVQLAGGRWLSAAVP